MSSPLSPPSPTAPRFALRYVQMARAGIAAIAAIMVTFSPDHSASVGLAVFSGFAIVTGLIELISAWLTYPVGRRAAPVLLGALSVIAGMLAGIVGWRSTTFFFALVITWAIVTGLIEAIWALRERRVPALRPEARDSLVVGGYCFVHAGIKPGIPLDRQKPEDLRWIRDSFLDYEGSHGMVVVHGHSISSGVEEMHNRIGIDTGAYQTGILTAIRIEGATRRMIAVDERTA